MIFKLFHAFSRRVQPSLSMFFKHTFFRSQKPVHVVLSIVTIRYKM
jgi:hypothetical protein